MQWAELLSRRSYTGRSKADKPGRPSRAVLARGRYWTSLEGSRRAKGRAEGE